MNIFREMLVYIQVDKPAFSAFSALTCLNRFLFMPVFLINQKPAKIKNRNPLKFIINYII